MRFLRLLITALVGIFGLISNLSAQNPDIPVVVNKISTAKAMLLLDDSNSMMAIVEHSDFNPTAAAVTNTANAIPDLIFRLNSGTAAPTTSHTLVPALFSINWHNFSVSGTGTSIYSGAALSSASSIPVVTGSACMNSSGNQVNCPGSSSTPRTGINSLRLYSSSSVLGSNAFTIANLARNGSVNVTDASGNEYLYINYRQNDYPVLTQNWGTYWPRLDANGQPLTYRTTVYSTSGGRIVFNGKEVFLSAGLYRIEYLRWIFYVASSTQLAELPGITRMDAVKDAAVALVQSNPNVRFGLASLNGSNLTAGTWGAASLGDHFVTPSGLGTVGGRPRIRAAIGTTNTNLITEIGRFTGVGSTPLTTTYIETLRYFNGERDNDPYCSNCQYTSPITSPCDGNFVIALTDGLPVNESQNQVNNTWISDFDGDGAESASNNRNCTDPVCAQFFDDAAWYGFHSDFNRSLTGTQMVRSYAIGFGLNYSLLNRFAANGGSGASIQVNTASEVSDALQSVVSNLITTAVGAAGVATAEVFGDSGQVFRPRFEALHWTGSVDKFVSVNGNLVKVGDFGEVLEQRDLVASPRNIFAGIDSDGDGLTSVSVPFTTQNVGTLRPELFRQFSTGVLNSSLLASPLQNISSNSSANILIDYIRGTDQPDLRGRDGNGNGKTERLGDIVYSRPVYVADRMGNYRSMNGYTSYVQGRQNQVKILLVGANDGMLHAFDAESGVELWAYIPSSLLKHLELLARPTYETSFHKYFVNGQIGVEDVFVNGSWRTYAMFGLGGGGSTWTVLDITNRSAPTLVWEVSHPNSGGESWSEPVVAPVGGGSATDPGSYSWFMLVGTGEGKPGTGTNLLAYSLSSVTPPTPTVISIASTAPVGTRTTGLTVSQNDNDFNVDRGYIGTEEGHMYRVNMNGLPNTWSVTRIFQGTSTQPIVAKPALVLAANPQHTGSGSGPTNEALAVGVFFGTGRYDQPNDVTTVGATTQSIIGLYDPTSITIDTYATCISNVTRAQLVNQSASVFGVLRKADGVFNLPLPRAGFYMDLDTAIQVTGQNFIRPVGMVTYPPLNIRGTVIFSTFLPSQQQCAVGGYGFIQAVNYMTGGGSIVDYIRNPQDPFYNGGIPDLDGNSTINNNDLTVGYSSGKVQPVFDARVESVDLTNERPYKHDGKLFQNDIWLHASNGGIMPAVASLGIRGVPGPPAILYQNGQIVVQSAYTDSGDTGYNEDDNEPTENITICVVTDASNPDKLVRDTRTISEDQLAGYLSQGATIGICPEDDDDSKVMICHIPPGNPENRHTITVSINAWPAHQAHGDFEGPCDDSDDDDNDDQDEDQDGDLENPDSLPINLYTQPLEVLSFREVTTD
jgi:type IV pilus assembly protein PilY1